MQMQLYALEGAVICLVYMFINLILSHINYADFKHETDAKFKDIEFLVDIALFQTYANPKLS
jgi:hypothetical protein